MVVPVAHAIENSSGESEALVQPPGYLDRQHDERGRHQALAAV